MIADSQLKAGTMDKAEDDSSPFAILPILRVQEAPYLSAGELDEPARPQEPVIVPFPDEPLQTGRAAGVLVLYIGADGKVDRVEVDEADWSPGFEKVAIETFMQAKMQPGIKDGKTSRSRMKILVEFEGQ
ncbi:energy transducer TonB [Noviherbaspirillum cavernae]|nr:energy transducer TonB [Noviherbaspirillum cavernae]